MMRARLKWVALAFVGICALAVTLYFVRRPACEDIGSWDECEDAGHCSPVKLIADRDYDGPAWLCSAKWNHQPSK